MWASTAFSSLGLFYPRVVWPLCIICSFQSFQSTFSTLLLFAFFIRAIRHLPLSLKFRWVHLWSLCQIPAPPASWMSLEFFSHSELLTAPVQNTSSVYLSAKSPLRASVLVAGPQPPLQLTVCPNWLLVLLCPPPLIVPSLEIGNLLSRDPFPLSSCSLALVLPSILYTTDIFNILKHVPVCHGMNCVPPICMLKP